MAVIDWARDARSIHDLVRALNPDPGAVASLDGDVVKVWRTRVAADDAAREDDRGRSHAPAAAEPPPPGTLPPGFENKVMHTTFRIGETAIMASDGCAEGPKFEGFSLSLSVPTEAEADRVFAALSKGGQVRMPLTKTFWSPYFGMVTDRFGVLWMIYVVPPGRG